MLQAKVMQDLQDKVSHLQKQLVREKQTKLLDVSSSPGWCSVFLIVFSFFDNFVLMMCCSVKTESLKPGIKALGRLLVNTRRKIRFQV